MKPLAPNSMIQNRYLLVHLIGKGGMGEVYLAVDQRLGSAVALKRTFFADDEMLGNAFEREARTLARLRHPVLPKVSDHFSENGEQYLIMEHIAGDDLAKRLETAKKPFPLSWVLFWADQLLDALSYLHSHEPPIIHRDIKPQNLKLTDENHIVLLDFGLSKNSTGQTNLSSGSSSGSVVGYTPHYAPMEQIRGTGTNAKSDIYALSATLYQLMTNTVPADALSRADSLLNGMADPIRPLDEVNPEVSPEISKVILKGMEVSQDKRYATAREMQKALRKAYNAMQEAMSAHTVAFNANDFGGGAEPPAGRSVPPNEAFHHEPSAASELPTRITSGASGGFPGVSQSGDSGPSVFDSAAPPPVSDMGIRQADVKTEVYRAGDSPLSEAAATENYHQDISSTPATENYHQDLPAVPASPFTEDFRDEIPANADTGYSPDATVPNISYGESGAGSGGLVPPSDEFFTSPNAGAADPFATVTAGPAVQEEFTSTPEPEPVARPIAAVPAKKNSKMPYLLGGLAALFILGIAILGAGWFVYTNYYDKASVSPSPQPTPEFSPTPEPTVENVYVPNTNDNSNSNTNLTVEPTPVPTPVPTQETPEEPVQQAPSTPRENPRVTRTPTTRQTGTPAVRPTPTKAKPNNRTDIIQ